MKKILKILIFIIFVIFGGIYVSNYSWFLEGVAKIYFTGHTTSYLSDYKVFDNNEIPVSSNPQPWPIHKKYNTTSPSSFLESHNKKNKTVAYLVIKNDSLYYEKYYDGYGLDSKSNSFSMSKSIVSALLGKAIMDGYIESLDQPVYQFLPEIKGPYSKIVTLGDLSSMSSGLDWQEEYYSPVSITASSYFINDLKSLILNQEIINEPGKSYSYLSGATQLLGMSIVNATGQSLSEYLYKSFWDPMGAENSALWQLDSKKNNIEKAFCCIASNARDFARFGKLYKDFGQWNGKTLIDSAFVVKSISPRFQKSPEYGYSWWLENFNGHKVFLMRGHLGQYVIVLPDENIIVVRLGHLKGKSTPNNPRSDVHIYLDEAIKMINNTD
jgi:CubicO group peptidase (beta-lactamase class C family)